MVGCLVINWNGWRDTIACLTTLQAQTVQTLEVFVVDNGSTDDSVPQIEQFIASARGPVRFHLIRHSTNVGFAAGVNIGARVALGYDLDFLWLLNNDTECPPDTLAKLLRAANANPAAGIIGTVLYYYDRPSVIQAWGGGRINRVTATSAHYDAPTTQDHGSYATFASVLIRTDVFEEIGLLYQGFFMYYDDADFCLRMAEKSNWKIVIAEDTAVLHKESASTEGTRNPFMEKTITVSALRFLRLHSPVPTLSLILLPLIKLANRARRGEWDACRAVFQGIKEFRAGSMDWTAGLSSDQTIAVSKESLQR